MAMALLKVAKNVIVALAQLPVIISICFASTPTCAILSTANGKSAFIYGFNLYNWVFITRFPTTTAQIVSTTEPFRSTHRHGFTKDHHGHDHGGSTNGSDLSLPHNNVGNNVVASPLAKQTGGNSVKAGTFNNENEEGNVDHEISSEKTEQKNTTTVSTGKRKSRKRKVRKQSASSEKPLPFFELVGLFLAILLLFSM